MGKEVGKDIPGYEGLYQVSNIGNVKSLNYKNTGSSKNLQKTLGNSGYYHVSLYLNGKIKNYLIHRLVARAFVNNSDNLPVVNHRNEIKTDNRAENLEGCSAQYNTMYGTGIQRAAEKQGIPVNQYDKAGNYITTWKSIIDAERHLNIPNSKSHIVECCKGKRPSAYGFKGKYAD